MPEFNYTDPVVLLIDKPKLIELAAEADKIISESTWANVIENSGDLSEFETEIHDEGFFPVINVDGPKGPNAEWTLTILCRLRDDFPENCDVTPEGAKFCAAELVISGSTFLRGIPISRGRERFDWMGSLHPKHVWEAQLA